VEQFADSYRLAKEPQALVERLRLLPEFAHLRGSRIVCVFSERVPMLRGFPCAAFIGEPRVQGAFRPLFDWMVAQLCRPLLGAEDPEFLVIVDAALWPSLEKVQRERLVYHELCHLKAKENPETGEPRLHEDGRPQLQVVPHDVEIFEAEVARYGPEVCDLDALCTAIVEGQKRARKRAGAVA